MSYSKNTWATGETITAAKMNNIENGIDTLVSGVNDGTNWTSITLNGTTKAIPAGGSGGSSDVVVINVKDGDYGSLYIQASDLPTLRNAFAYKKVIVFVANWGQYSKNAICSYYERNAANTGYVFYYSCIGNDGKIYYSGNWGTTLPDSKTTDFTIYGMSEKTTTSGVKLYQHNMDFYNGYVGGYMYAKVVSTKNNSFSSGSSLIEYLKGQNSFSEYVTAYDFKISFDNIDWITPIVYLDNNNNEIKCMYLDSNNYSTSSPSWSYLTISSSDSINTDNCYEIINSSN